MVDPEKFNPTILLDEQARSKLANKIEQHLNSLTDKLKQKGQKFVEWKGQHSRSMVVRRQTNQLFVLFSTERPSQQSALMHR